jgi:hypothetical protein
MIRANRKRLNEAYRAYMQARYPSVPEHGLPSRYQRTDNNANGLTACIKDWIQWHGGQCERVSNQGQARVNKIQLSNGLTRSTVTWTPGQGTRGTADLHAIIQGRAVKIEVKYGKDRQSEAQKAYMEAIQQAGGVYIIARDFDGFLEWWDGFVS